MNFNRSFPPITPEEEGIGNVCILRE